MDRLTPIQRKELLREKDSKRSEASLQFEEIFEAHHDPIERERRALARKRKKRAENTIKDLGL
ncbi:MAG: hypothetical protein WC346_01360 [Methanogenium sp.]|jgi:hypothetical protein